jgi:tetratricopeptide (TPR) repeat protein
MQYERFVSGESLQSAIDAVEEAVDLAPDRFSRAIFLNTLGSFVRLRFEAYGQSKDISQAISYYERAIEDHPDKAMAYHQLSSALTKRFEVLGVEHLSDLDRAINILEEGLIHAEDRTALLQTIAMSLCMRSEHTDSLTDLDRAVSAAKEATYCYRPLG